MLLPRVLVESRICLNVHPSALPRWRGATPVQSTLMAGDSYTEVCIMRLEAGMDTGPVYDRTPLEVPHDMSAGKLNDIVWAFGAERLCYVVENVDKLTPVAQVGEPTFAPKLNAEMRVIDWNKPAGVLHNLVRGLSPNPSATAVLGGEVVKVIRAEVAKGEYSPAPAGEIVAMEKTGAVVACGGGFLRVVAIQRPGKEAKPVAEIANGWAALQVGARFA